VRVEGDAVDCDRWEFFRSRLSVGDPRARWMTELGGDELFGLQAAFATAGARAGLGSLWVANDSAAALPMTALHAELARGCDPEIALQAAILDYRARFADRRQAYFGPHSFSRSWAAECAKEATFHGRTHAPLRTSG
jgi:hypothetical protein